MRVGSIFAAGSALAIAIIPSLAFANGLFEDGSWQFQSASQLQALVQQEALIQQKKGGAFGTPQTFQTIGSENIGTLNQGNNVSGGSTLSTGGNTGGVGSTTGSGGGGGGKGSIVGELNGQVH
jgi:hypothetical protein